MKKVKGRGVKKGQKEEKKIFSSFVARVCGFAEQSGFMLNECVRVS